MKIISWVSLFISVGSVAVVSVCYPQFLVENHFLKNFMNHEFLNILAVIMTVTAASTANIHLAFNRAEEKIKKPRYFQQARKEINQGAIVLILLFLLAIAVLIARSYYIHNITIVSLLNGAGLVILLINVLVLVDVTLTVFAIHPLIPNSDES